jgi:hypothetical protein
MDDVETPPRGGSRDSEQGTSEMFLNVFASCFKVLMLGAGIPENTWLYF